MLLHVDIVTCFDSFVIFHGIEYVHCMYHSLSIPLSESFGLIARVFALTNSTVVTIPIHNILVYVASSTQICNVTLWHYLL